MKAFPKIRRLAKVEFLPEEFLRCITTVEEAMRRYGSRDPRLRLELIGGFFDEGGEQRGMAFEARVRCMAEILHSPKIGTYSAVDPKSNKTVSRVAVFHAAALAPLHYDDDNMFFDEDEFLGILKVEDAMLAKLA